MKISYRPGGFWCLHRKIICGQSKLLVLPASLRGSRWAFAHHFTLKTCVRRTDEGATEQPPPPASIRGKQKQRPHSDIGVSPLLQRSAGQPPCPPPAVLAFVVCPPGFMQRPPPGSPQVPLQPPRSDTEIPFWAQPPKYLALKLVPCCRSGLVPDAWWGQTAPAL